MASPESSRGRLSTIARSMFGLAGSGNSSDASADHCMVKEGDGLWLKLNMEELTLEWKTLEMVDNEHPKASGNVRLMDVHLVRSARAVGSEPPSRDIEIMDKTGRNLLRLTAESLEQRDLWVHLLGSSQRFLEPELHAQAKREASTIDRMSKQQELLERKRERSGASKKSWGPKA